MRTGRRPGTALAVLAAAGGLLAAGGGPLTALRAQDAGGMAHIGIVVRDVETSAAAYAALAGTAPPDVQATEERGEAVRTARIRLANVDIDLIEPAGGPDGAFRAFLDTRGQGVQHLALRTGRAGDLVDMTEHLGLMVEMVGPAADGALREAAAAGGDLDHPACITHVGVVVRDIAASRAALTDLTGMEPTPVREFQAARGRAVFSVFRFDNVSIELLQQVDGELGTYTDFLDRYGQRAHHVGVHFRHAGGSLDMPQQNARVERHGGVLAADGGGHRYFDLWPQLGLHVETLPPATNDTVYPHPHADQRSRRASAAGGGGRGD